MPGPKRPAKKQRPKIPLFGKKPPAKKVPATASDQKAAVIEGKEEDRPMTIRLPGSVKLALKRMARADQRSASKQIEMLIRREAAERARLAKPATPTVTAPKSDSGST